MNEKINENLKPPMSEIKAKLNNLDIQNVSGNTCPHCNGTGKMQQDYYDDNDMSKITTIDEVCLGCDGSGIDE